ncbi:hypothetical protein FQR65_LT03934 [Abscondita terminalis]|nr:hypothetical protein FQR65_LT03934 [Abscondita terminalis]
MGIRPLNQRHKQDRYVNLGTNFKPENSRENWPDSVAGCLLNSAVASFSFRPTQIIFGKSVSITYKKTTQDSQRQKNVSTGYTPPYLSFAKKQRTPIDVHHDLRAIIDNENLTEEITQYLRKLANTLDRARETYEIRQDLSIKCSDFRHREVDPYAKKFSWTYTR